MNFTCCFFTFLTWPLESLKDTQLTFLLDRTVWSDGQGLQVGTAPWPHAFGGEEQEEGQSRALHRVVLLGENQS